MGPQEGYAALTAYAKRNKWSLYKTRPMLHMQQKIQLPGPKCIAWQLSHQAVDARPARERGAMGDVTYVCLGRVL